MFLSGVDGIHGRGGVHGHGHGHDSAALGGK